MAVSKVTRTNIGSKPEFVKKVEEVFSSVVLADELREQYITTLEYLFDNSEWSVELWEFDQLTDPFTQELKISGIRITELLQGDPLVKLITGGGFMLATSVLIPTLINGKFTSFVFVA